ncbi:hypothetical protein SAMN05421594_4335 [Chryseobacterium oleae]|uniref:Uncharacterized protein n=1 Tax=Chryseobacterium oleae TaxID=491207 RepID=A0A1I5C719_CHROL|nr:hypothetical protein SAMN05421594_4335 [Chryseobacterium oleae]
MVNFASQVNGEFLTACLEIQNPKFKIHDCHVNSEFYKQN